MPNPGSNIGIVARIFRELYPDLKDLPVFGLDDMTRIMINRGLVTSQGAVGEEALKRSTRPDRSRDPLYNQSKMYAEVYRLLGLIKSGQSALAFRISLLGHYFGTALEYPPLLKECLIGLAYPNPAVDVRSDQRTRLFLCILRYMAALDGRISRDEIIVGPMSIGNDMDTEEFQSSVNLLRKLRSTLRGTETAINELSRKIGIKLDTMKNYTRIPIGVLLWTGWATKQRGYFVLTGVGKADLKSAEEARDIRLEYFANLQTKFQIPLVRVSFYEMLSRAGFDTNPVRSTLEEDRRTLVLGGFKQNRTILLSPFQQLDDSILDATFEEKRSPIVGTPTANVSAAPGPGRASEGSRITLRQSAPASSAAASGTDEIRRVLQETLKTTGNAQ